MTRLLEIIVHGLRRVVYRTHQRLTRWEIRLIEHQFPQLKGK